MRNEKGPAVPRTTGHHASRNGHTWRRDSGRRDSGLRDSGLRDTGQRHARTGRLGALLALAMLGGCVPAPSARAPSPVSIEAASAPSDAWRRIASAEDADRIARTDAAWKAGLAELRRANIVSAVREEGALLDPEAALPRPAPTPGSYECRLVKIGAEARGRPALEKFKPFFCYVEVEGELFTIVKQTGSERPAGRLWDDDEATRMVFLGSLALGGEDEVKAYGDDPKRDMAGLFERVGPFRWRLVIPWPRDGAKLDVFELTPVAQQPS